MRVLALLVIIAPIVVWGSDRVALAGPSCTIEVNYSNKTKNTIRLDAKKSQVSLTEPGPAARPSPPKTFMPEDIELEPNKNTSQSATLDLACDAGDRRFTWYIHGKPTGIQKQKIVRSGKTKIQLTIR